MISSYSLKSDMQCFGGEVFNTKCKLNLIPAVIRINIPLKMTCYK